MGTMDVECISLAVSWTTAGQTPPHGEDRVCRRRGPSALLGHTTRPGDVGPGHHVRQEEVDAEGHLPSKTGAEPSFEVIVVELKGRQAVFP